MKQKEKNIHLITHYEALFNDEKATCALTIDMEKFNIDCLREKELVFSVDYKDSNIRIQSDNDIFVFLNADKELIYYASKTDKLPLIFGTVNPPEMKGAFVAEPNFNE